ncbi:MAG TPA: ligand-gated channel protein, partial [Polyangiales bacterium]|nr:ligand-gated channel protein [Polyangiales bacterium]
RYRAYGVVAEVGVVDRPWARKLIVQGFTSGFEKELQHNRVMSVPYGEAKTAEYVYGSLLRYQHAPLAWLELDAALSHAFRAMEFVDKSQWVYDWYGERVSRRRVRGEVEAQPRDQVTWQHNVFGRLTLAAKLGNGQRVTLNVSPQFVTRTGDERFPLDPGAVDPMSGVQQQLTVVSGLEYRSQFLGMPAAPRDPQQRRDEDYRIENTVFAKWYSYHAASEELNAFERWNELSTTYNRFGFGDGLRVMATRWLLFKASYELATRLPRPDETFGDGGLGRANYELKPELSHNVNVGPLFDIRLAGFGDLTVDLNAFLRETRDQIVALGDDRTFMYRNVSDARSLGGEGAVKWDAPGRYVTVSGALTAQDQRNRSTKPPFDKYNGDRIPNRPWLFASWAAAVRGFELFMRGDSVELFYAARYTQSFYRGWASIGFKEWKDVVPSQLNHDLGVTYGWRMLGGSFHLTAELQNITDARLFDMFGVQRPGRAFFAKLSAQL